MMRPLSGIGLALLALAAPLTACGGGDGAGSSERCEVPEDLPWGGAPRPGGQLFDVVVWPGRGYVLATSNGVLEVDRCSFRRIAHCDDPSGARSLYPRAGTHVVDYRRANGSTGACRLTDGAPVAPAELAPPALRTRQGNVVAWIDEGEAWIRVGDRPERRLRTSAEAFDVAITADRRWAAVTHRSVSLSIFQLPGGALRTQFPLAGMNHYGVAFDDANDRVLATAGHGVLAVRSMSEVRR